MLNSLRGTLSRSEEAQWFEGIACSLARNETIQVGDISAAAYAELIFDVASAVNIDVQPNDDNNFVKTDGNFSDKMFVAIEGSATFDAAQVDSATVKFGPGEATPFTVPGTVVDTNNDGIDDMRLKFRIADTGLGCGYNDENVTLTGETNGGIIQFEGSDSVTTDLCDATSCHP
jgi:hypothetical protein